jgi:Papain family cysteine protease
MDINIARAKSLAQLPDLVKPEEYGLGALPLNPDTRLRHMMSLSIVRAAAAAPIPAAADLSAFVKDCYNQGQEDSCVAYSCAGMMSVFEDQRSSNWIKLNAEECYVACGGSGQNGISTKDALDWIEQKGFGDSNDQKRYQVATYAFTDPRTVDGWNTLRAALAADLPCVIALLLPSDFGAQFGASGDCGSTTITNAYHQVCAIGYTNDRLNILNSWGPTWGNQGMGSILLAAIQAPQQQNYAYAYTVSFGAEPASVPFFTAELDRSAIEGNLPWSSHLRARRQARLNAKELDG